MSDNSGIAWTNATWNPVTGCTKVSQGCKHCYAEREWARLSANPKATAYYGRAFADVACHEDRLDQPLRWSRPRLIFVSSMSDLFHEDVPDEFIDQVFAVMGLSFVLDKNHVFQVLTKRPDRMLVYLENPDTAWRVTGAMKNRHRAGLMGENSPPVWPLPNVWLGVSVEDQETADQRIPILLRVPAAIHWISAEPLLGPVELSFLSAPDGPPSAGSGLEWVVCGGESGHHVRPMHAEWARRLRWDCKKAGVPFFMKQLGAAFSDAENGIAGAGLDISPDIISRRLIDRAGADMDEWPEELRVREWPSAGMA